jgi:hypothetical protein
MKAKPIILLTILMLVLTPFIQADLTDFFFNSPAQPWGVNNAVDVFYIGKSITYGAWVLDSSLFKYTSMGPWSSIGFASEKGTFTITELGKDNVTLTFGSSEVVARIWTPFGSPSGVNGPADIVWSPDERVTTVTSTDSGVVTISWLAEERGYLRVTTSPPLPSTILVDGVPRNDWGLDWVKMPIGSHTISFTDVPGFVTPENQTILVNLESTTTITGSFSPKGYLHVVTEPALPATIYLDGLPMNDWGIWVPLDPGDYTVSFGGVEGYSTPLAQVTIINEGETTTITGVYSAGSSTLPSAFGYLRVTTNPALSGTILVDGHPRNDWGLDWVKVDSGVHKVSFTDVPGYLAPENLTVTVNEGETTTVEGRYTPLGYLHVTTSPACQSTILVNDIPMNDWGCWVPLLPGQYTVSWGLPPEYFGQTPTPQTVTVIQGVSVTVDGLFP